MYSYIDFTESLLNLFPSGIAWRKDIAILDGNIVPVTGSQMAIKTVEKKLISSVTKLPVLSEDDFCLALQDLLPSGIAWNRG